MIPRLAQLAFLGWFLTSHTLASAQASCEISEEQRAQILSLPLEAFDGDQKLGWRKFWSAKCEREAIDLLSQYRVGEARSYRINFHEAQLRLAVGEAALARPLLFAALRSDLPADSAFRWNDYVLGYIAYVDADTQAMDYYIQRLQQASTDRGNSMNLVILRKLRDGAGRSYRQIFSD